MSRFLVPLLLFALTSGELGAQRVPSGNPPPGARAPRAELERRFRERFEQVLKERLALSDAQMTQVIAVNTRLDGKRRELFTEERTVRKEMRDALEGGDEPATQERVSQLLERALRVQRLRLDLVETEQRELSAFLSPVQRAKYLGLQEQLRHRADEMRRRAAGDTASDPLGLSPEEGARRRPFRRPGVPPT